MASSIPLLRVFLFFLLSKRVFANDDLNVYGGVGPNVICVFPMSGPYNLLQRLLFYTLLAFAIIARRQQWMVIGALASAMSYSGAAAIHGLLLVSPARRAIDLDIYGIFALTSSGAMITAPLLNWSSTLMYAEKRKRWIVMLWGILLVLGAIFTAACIHVNGAGYITPECFPRSQASSSNGSLFPSPTEDCVYTCPPEKRLFRPKTDVVAWPNHINRPRDITSVFLPATVTYIFIWAIMEVLLRTVLRNRNIPLYFSSASSARQIVGLRRIGTFIQSRRNTSKSQDIAISGQPASSPSPSVSSWLPAQTKPQEPPSRFGRLFKSFHFYIMLAHLAAFITNVVMCEYRMKDFPSNEQPKEIGQWISWVSVALVVFAQSLNHYLKIRWGADERKRMPPQDEEKALTLDRWRLGISPAARMTGEREGPLVRNDPSKRPGVHPEMKIFRSETTSSMRRNSF
ncbi:hypothetical protein AJ79_05898 [Helicocarpus griseus UAMH5409]|uniref:Uncharacterized protein n=1 Tax=Helicocarpus griseus UAMH5409 TaxID=1447875 RepID=A0A2B7XJA3_9EURO|nr:hypothetical protein AJ79_05898 [Helicocarpus griseus UAMH5409]